MDFYAYMLQCRDASFYVGHTDDLEARLEKHRNRTYCGYTSKRLPVKLVFAATFATRDEAFHVERQLKGWSRAKKIALIQGDWELVSRVGFRHTQPTSPRPSAAHGFECLTMSGSGPPRTSAHPKNPDAPPRL